MRVCVLLTPIGDNNLVTIGISQGSWAITEEGERLAESITRTEVSALCKIEEDETQ